MMIAVSPQAVGHLQIDISSNTISRIRNNRTTAIKLLEVTWRMEHLRYFFYLRMEQVL